MANELYFVPLLLDAFDAEDRREAFSEAFAEILRRGAEPGYETGLAQFRSFMAVVVGTAGSENEIERLFLEACLNSVDAAQALQVESKEVLEALLAHRPEWRQAYEQLAGHLLQPDDRDYPMEIILEYEGRPRETQTLVRPPALCRMSGLVPGAYTLRMAIGRFLWEGSLGRQDLEWAAAHPGRPLDLAADTGDELVEPTREYSLLRGELVMKVFPGLETGTMTISVVERDK
jgi:hypothetical protein